MTLWFSGIKQRTWKRSARIIREGLRSTELMTQTEVMPFPQKKIPHKAALARGLLH